MGERFRRNTDLKHIHEVDGMPTILHSLNHMVTPWWKKLAQHAGLSENVVFFKPPNFHKSSYIWWKSQPQKIFNETYVWHITGWWLSHPSENYEFVSWDDYSLWKHNPNVPNHQPVSYSPIINHYQPSLTMINHYWPSLSHDNMHEDRMLHVKPMDLE